MFVGLGLADDLGTGLGVLGCVLIVASADAGVNTVRQRDRTRGKADGVSRRRRWQRPRD